MSANLGSPIRIVIPAAAATAIALIAAGMLGVASAEAPTTTSPPPTVSVQGVATEPIEQSATAASATAVYRQGMADAISDGQAKAQFLASKAGVTLGAVQSIVEDGGYIGCTSSEESSNDEYQGAQPDFGSPGVATPVTAVSTPRAVTKTTPGMSKPALRHGKKKRKKPSAKQASATTCTLSTQVSLVYTLS